VKGRAGRIPGRPRERDPSPGYGAPLRAAARRFSSGDRLLLFRVRSGGSAPLRSAHLGIAPSLLLPSIRRSAPLRESRLCAGAGRNEWRRTLDAPEPRPGRHPSLSVVRAAARWFQLSGHAVRRSWRDNGALHTSLSSMMRLMLWGTAPAIGYSMLNAVRAACR
jgi:hypothetical protein